MYYVNGDCNVSSVMNFFGGNIMPKQPYRSPKQILKHVSHIPEFGKPNFIIIDKTFVCTWPGRDSLYEQLH